MWKTKSHLAMRTDFHDEAAQLISSDLRDLGSAANKLAKHAVKLGVSGVGVSIVELIASIAAMYVIYSTISKFPIALTIEAKKKKKIVVVLFKWVSFNFVLGFSHIAH